MNAQTQAAQAAKSAADQAGGNAAPQEQPRPDPFANLPTVTLNGEKVLDLSGVDVSNPRKYAKISEAAIAAKLPMQAGWKHSEALFVPGNTSKDFRAGSVFGTLVDIVKRAGKGGIASYELCTELRRAQIGNKRSHYCEKTPPTGWAEGYINSAVTQGLINVHATRKAPALVAPAPAPAAKPDGDGKATGTNG